MEGLGGRRSGGSIQWAQEPLSSYGRGHRGSGKLRNSCPRSPSWSVADAGFKRGTTAITTAVSQCCHSRTVQGQEWFCKGISASTEASELPRAVCSPGPRPWASASHLYSEGVRGRGITQEPWVPARGHAITLGHLEMLQGLRGCHWAQGSHGDQWRKLRLLGTATGVTH